MTKESPLHLAYTPNDYEIIMASDALAAKARREGDEWSPWRGLIDKPISGRGYPNQPAPQGTMEMYRPE
jgi:hypothetical protein